MGGTVSEIVSSARPTRARPALYLGLAGHEPKGRPARYSLARTDRVEIGRGDRRLSSRKNVDGADVLTLQLTDSRMSSRHARITRLGKAWFLEDLGSKNGTTVRGKPVVERSRLEDGDWLMIGHTALVFRESGGEVDDLDGNPSALAAGLATLSPELAARFADLAKAARSMVPIEISGESGTGKELAARAVHSLSGRSGRFAALNCGALAPTLLEGELFGHKRGAFTGAKDDRGGVIRSSDGGTLFLDEVAELAPPSQAALLRVLQEGEVLPLGADRPVKVDLRIVTATHKALDGEVAGGRFRGDLRARMLGVQVALPALRERREDLGHLVSALLERVAPNRSVRFSAAAVAALYAHEWPLNIRELERALAAAIAISDDEVDVAQLPASLRALAPGIEVRELSPEELALRASLAAAIDRHDGNLSAVARELGKDRTQIRRWMKRFGLTRDED